MQVYDYYTPAEASASEVYINDRAKSEGAATWPFVDQRYNWTADGTHKFFGWLHTDVNMGMTADAFFGSALTLKTGIQTLEIPETTLKQDSDQFDFLYSNVHVRNLNDSPDYVTPVPLEFHHLFTAFSIGAKNMSTSDITVKSISIEGLKNKRSATIKYDGVGDQGLPVVEYTTSSNDDPNTFEFVFTPNTELAAGATDATAYTDMSTPLTSDRDFFLMWPKAADNPDDASDDVIFKVTYITGNDSKEITVDVKVPNEWVAGKKNNVNIKFIDKQLVLECVVQPWEVESETIDFADQVVSVSKTMTWEGVQDVDYETGEVILKNDGNAIATCTFKIDTPVGATWTASLILANEDGSIDAFSWVDDTKYGVVGTGTDSEIKLKVNKFAPIAPQHICILRITVQTSDMRTIVVNDLAPSKYTDENGVEHNTNGYTEFRIIQNIITG